jgi:hypothetical protein
MPHVSHARRKATVTYVTRWNACHGNAGRGDGPQAANLIVRPLLNRSRSQEIDSSIIGRSPGMMAR